MVENGGSVARYWRNQNQRYIGAGSPLFEARTEVGTDEEDRLIKGFNFKCDLFKIDTWWFEEAEKEGYLEKWGGEVVAMLRAKKFNEEVIGKTLFGLASVWGRGGEKLVRGGMSAMGIEKLEEKDLVEAMKVLEFEKEAAREWLFSVNGYRKSDPQGRIVVERLVEEVFA